MRLTPRDLLALLLLSSLAFAGCGSPPSYADTTRPAVAKMQSVIRTYNQNHIASLPAEAAACASAGKHLQGARSALEQKSPPSEYRQITTALRRAYALARAAFVDCAAAARYLSYPLMAQADREVAQANAWIARAHRLDR